MIIQNNKTEVLFYKKILRQKMQTPMILKQKKTTTMNLSTKQLKQKQYIEL